jgi:hypothetical protein
MNGLSSQNSIRQTILFSRIFLYSDRQNEPSNSLPRAVTEAVNPPNIMV